MALRALTRGKVAPLSAAAELEIARLAHAGDRRARVELLEANLAIVRHVVARWRRPDLAEDLAAAGRLALWRAVLAFDPERGARFSALAFPVVARAVGLEALRLASVASGWTRHLSRDARELASGSLAGDAAEAAAARVGLRRGDLSLDVPIGDEADGATWLEAVTTPHPDAEPATLADEQLDAAELRARVRAAVAAAPLTPRQRAIVAARALAAEGDEETLEQLGARFRVTRERVRQVEGVAHERLARALAAQGLGPELRRAS